MMAAMTLLGLNSCDDLISPVVEYGTPITDFQYHGQVTDMEGTPIKGIRVVAKNRYSSDGVPYSFFDGPADTLYTDADGKFQSRTVRDYFAEDLRLVFDDVDGSENGGEFMSATAEGTEMTITQVKKGDGWYNGEYDVAVTKKLERKAATTEE